MNWTVLVLYILYFYVADGLPLYTDTSNETLALVLCGNLNDGIVALKQRELLEHEIGAHWLEGNCVSINPCAQTTSNEDPIFGVPLPALAGVWLSGNSSALRLALSTDRMLDAEAGVRAENYGSLEFARVPEGLRVQACAPDFDRWRRAGVLACNEETVVTITADAAARACPGARDFSLLDCVRPLQFDAGLQTLVRRPPGEKMHFGSLTRTEACASPGSALAARLCADAAEYSVQLPVAAVVGSTSLVKYEFLEGYACRRGSEVQEEGKVLSQAAAPNLVVTCPTVADGSAVRVDPYTCGIACDAGFELSTSAEGGVCVSVCAGLNATCPETYRATGECLQGSLAFYHCAPCPPQPGFAARPPVEGTDDLFLCHYSPCAPGTKSDGLRCEACGVNTFSNASLARECASCETVETGLYQPTTGQTACAECMWNTTVTVEACSPNTSLVQDFHRVQHLFSLYATDVGARLEDYVVSMCTQGFACLPCEPGHYERERACVPCPHGAYQPNFAAQACYPCAEGQNTTAIASTRSSDCLCVHGFE
jgi:hypothetical protein